MKNIVVGGLKGGDCSEHSVDIGVLHILIIMTTQDNKRTEQEVYSMVQTWTIKKADAKRLESCEMWFWRKSAGWTE